MPYRTCVICKGLVELPSCGDWFDGVCPTCRRHAEIGKRVEGMRLLEAGDMDDDQPRGRTEGYMDGWNDAVEEAKGEKP